MHSLRFRKVRQDKGEEVVTFTNVNKANMYECYMECVAIPRTARPDAAQLWLHTDNVLADDTMLAVGINCEAMLGLCLALLSMLEKDNAS